MSDSPTEFLTSVIPPRTYIRTVHAVPLPDEPGFEARWSFDIVGSE
jgi:hypothetical protein